MGKSRDAYIKDVRNSLSDYAHLNRLLDDEEEFSDDRLAYFLDKALDRYNTTPPPISSSSYEDFPSDSLLVDMAELAALESALILRSRNALTYTSDGTTVALDNVAEYDRLVQSLRARINQEIMSIKLSINLKRAFGKVHSPYRSS